MDFTRKMARGNDRSRTTALFGAMLVALWADLGTMGCGAQTGDLAHDVPDAAAGGNGIFIGDAGRPADANLTPDVFGPGAPTGACLVLGSACVTSSDCCSGGCVHGACAYPTCQSDGLACASDAECCSQKCASNRTCATLNTTCETLGNQCNDNAQCCSNLCVAGTCQASSFCGQSGDACAADADCCTGACVKTAGQSLGTCATSPPSGAANCGLADGQLCGAAGASSFFEGGIPSCGGPCCSRACAPWGPTGVLVCQPASGCHPVGDLCTTDTDCCGAAGILGGSGKPVTCDRSAGGTYGVCRLPMGCKPNGDVCKLQTTSCNSSCDCCSGNCETQDTCKQDNVGIPRCSGPQCVAAGASCASSADCCNGAPCVPNPGGSPPYVCHSTSCVSACGPCTNNADCCQGTSCQISVGSTQGACGPCGGGGLGDGGPPVVDAGSPADAGCALYGQVCASSSDCCYGVPCTFGRCQQPLQ
jgi:hypothetical protein